MKSTLKVKIHYILKVLNPQEYSKDEIKTDKDTAAMS